MILHEYAIEPAALAGWERFRYLVEKFGFQHGRLISRFPKRWEKEVLRACEGLAELEKKRIIEKLSHADFRRTRTVSGNRLFDLKKNWLANAEEQHAKLPFHAILARENPYARPFVIPTDGIDEDTPLMKVRREEKCNRSAVELSKTIQLMLQNSRVILFVDPHFDPARPKWRKPLVTWLQSSMMNGNKLIQCEYHLINDDSKPTTDAFKKTCTKELPRLLPKGLTLKLIRWNEKVGGEKFHARYILTDIGGIRIETGLDEGGAGETTDVSLLDISLWKTALEYFQDGTTPYEKADEVEVIGILER